MSNPLQEDKGLVEIHSICIKMNGIWRPTPCHDLGIDGQIEFLEIGTSISTGHIIAVQSKSGPSFFTNHDDKFVKFYPKEKHRIYWRRLKIPVILILHNPEDGETLYTKIKPQLDNTGPILVAKKDIFDVSCRNLLIHFSEEDSLEPSPKEVLDKLKGIKLYVDESKVITGIDFILACINKSEGYFEIHMKYINNLFDIASGSHSYTIGQRNYEFILRNILIIHSKKLVEDFLDDFEDIWYEQELVPEIISPLTSKGAFVIEFLWNNLEQYLSWNTYSHLNISDSTQLAQYITRYTQE